MNEATGPIHAHPLCGFATDRPLVTQEILCHTTRTFAQFCMQEAACIPTRAAVTIQGDAHEELMCSCLHVMSCHVMARQTAARQRQQKKALTTSIAATANWR